MRLTSFTDFGLRALMRMAAEPGRVHSTADIADEFGISRNHLAKAVGTLAGAGIVTTRRGTGGGAMLAQPAEELRLGDIVAVLERGSALVECFEQSGGSCSITASCRLKHFLNGARQTFIAHLTQNTLADCATSVPEVFGDV